MHQNDPVMVMREMPSTHIVEPEDEDDDRIMAYLERIETARAKEESMSSTLNNQTLGSTLG